MEKVYNSTLLPYSSGLVCLKEFFEKTHSLVQPYVQGKFVQNKEDYMISLLGGQYDTPTLRKLSAACKSTALEVPGQPKDINIDVSKRKRMLEKTEIPKETELATLKRRASQKGKTSRMLRYTPSIWLDHPMSSSWDVAANEIDLVAGEALVIALKVYHPFKHKIGEPVSRVPNASQEILVLGCNTLAEFRDKISCLADNLVSCDVSEDPLTRPIVKAIDKYPSGMFFINNKFYIDKRHRDSIDYSEIIRSWASNRNIKLGYEYSMEDTKFEDLSIRLGYPYLYQHQGNCEHLICFCDVRLLHESDPMQSSAYPLITCYFRRNVPHCMCCTNCIARWLTIGNARLPHDPFYFCDQCFTSFNYVDGKKIGDFKAYPFVSCDNADFLLGDATAEDE